MNLNISHIKCFNSILFQPRRFCNNRRYSLIPFEFFICADVGVLRAEPTIQKMFSHTITSFDESLIFSQKKLFHLLPILSFTIPLLSVDTVNRNSNSKFQHNFASSFFDKIQYSIMVNATLSTFPNLKVFDAICKYCILHKISLQE